ncbi:hypothetical protein [Piscicoccus intestinalis]|uniref:hypothetical protein n=1 Tax=Piscicoccus intestinalis TaxID=746033 RepID=UPI000838CE56|nr:hypothetical protein [Piscicoccus intestinalis]
MDQLWQIVAGLVPSIGIGFLFYKIMRAIIESDRNERLAHSRWDAEQDAREQRLDSIAEQRRDSAR